MQGDFLTTLPAAMIGRASPAKAAVGDKPVCALIAACRKRNARSPNASMPKSMRIAAGSLLGGWCETRVLTG